MWHCRTSVSSFTLSHIITHVLFPVVPVGICSILVWISTLYSSCLLYSFIALPIYYLTASVALAYPFITLHPRNISGQLKRGVLLGIPLSVFATCAVEILLLHDYPELSWAIGNSLYVILFLLGIPFLFYVDIDWNDRFQKIKRRKSKVRNIQILKFRNSTRDVESNQVLNHQNDQSKQRQNRPAIIWLTMFSVGVTIMISWIAYMKQLDSTYWTVLVFVLVLQIIVIRYDDKKISYDFSYLIFYSVVLVRLPDFLGHTALHFFALFGMILSHLFIYY